MNIRLHVSYDGTRYEGWQKQVRTTETIQGKLEVSLAECLGESVSIIGAGRTDGGVHAVGQVANVHVKQDVSLVALREEWNGSLPDDISVDYMVVVDDRFHARFGAIGKWYRYRLRGGTEKNVFERKFVWQYGKALDVDAMRAGAKVLIGTHDFTSCCNNKHLKKSAVRTITSLSVREEAGEVIFDVCGDGFLQGMIRILVGTLVEIGEGKRTVVSLSPMLEAKKRAEAGFTAPPQGLMLMEVFYEK